MATQIIDHVRSTVLAVLNKENRGYLTPAQYNLYAKDAQQKIFNLWFSEHAKLVAMRNARRLSADYGDRIKDLEDKLSKFTTVVTISPSGGVYPKPSDMHSYLAVQYRGASARKASLTKQLELTASNLTAPSNTYPSFSERNNAFVLSPYDSGQNVTLVYVRELLDPKWTYSTISATEEPIFNPSQSDYQDFEIPIEDAPMLVVEILKLAGLSIRETDVVNAAGQLDATQYQKENA